MKKVRELVERLGLTFQLDLAMVETLEDQEKRLYALEENRKVKDQSIKSLEHRYSELLSVVKSVLRENTDLKRQIEQLKNAVNSQG